MSKYPVATSTIAAALVSASFAITSQGQGARESVKVHGHWTIEIRDPDGRVAVRREFENRLTGPEIMSRVLARSSAPSRYRIALTNQNVDTNEYPGNATCNGGGSGYNPSPCFIQEASFVVVPGGYQSPNYSNNLQVGLAPNGKAVVLSGSITASDDGLVASVLSSITTDCDAQGFNCHEYPLTGTAIKNQSGQYAPILLKNQQQIQVTMVLSFS